MHTRIYIGTFSKGSLFPSLASGLHRYSRKIRGHAHFHCGSFCHGHLPALPVPGSPHRLYARGTFRSPHTRNNAPCYTANVGPPWSIALTTIAADTGKLEIPGQPGRHASLTRRLYPRGFNDREIARRAAKGLWIYLSSLSVLFGQVSSPRFYPWIRQHAGEQMPRAVSQLATHLSNGSGYRRA